MKRTVHLFGGTHDPHRKTRPVFLGVVFKFNVYLAPRGSRFSIGDRVTVAFKDELRSFDSLLVWSWGERATAETWPMRPR